MDEERTSKRSRFDQREPDAKRSRFDRRSRSPTSRRSETRGRSPIASEAEGGAERPVKSPGDAAAAAAAAAARINASLQARKGIQHVDVPPIQNSASPAPQAPPPTTNSSSSGATHAPVLSGQMYVDDGDYIQDIEVNDLRNRYVVTKGSTQKMIKEETGADVTTRGNYYPVKSLATAANPPLYLHVTSQSKEGLDQAVAKIQELIKQELPQLVDDRRLKRRDQDQVERDEYGRRKWNVEKVPIDLEPIPGFNLRAQVVGQGGAYVKHIQQETGCRVQIKGRGSGFIETQTNAESDEDMFLSITGPDNNMIEKAKELCIDLVGNVREQYEDFKSRPRQHSGYGGHRGGGHHGGYDHYSGGGRQQSYDHASHSPAPGASNAQSATDYYAQYAQSYGNANGQAQGQDPYAAYGGYNNYVAWYQYYAQAQQAQQPAAPGHSASPPPPPPSNAAPPPPSGSPPPPPPSGAAPGAGAYSSLPPPPGL